MDYVLEVVQSPPVNLEVVQAAAFSLEVTQAPATTLEVIQAPSFILEVTTGPRGPRGAPGLGAISADADNRLTVGSDDGLYVPEMVSDPLAYYILSKS